MDIKTLFGLLMVFGLLSCGSCKQDDDPDPEEKKEEENNKGSGIKVGAYYFHGWSGETDRWHVTERLKEEFPEREPVWGWYTNSVELMEQQIDYMADNNLDFFSFCWYHSSSQQQWILDALNEGLSFYLQSSNRNRLEFSLFISNHDLSFTMGPQEWNFCTQKWIELFKEEGYHKINGHPVIVFMRHDLLLTKWGTNQEIAEAFEMLKSNALDAGLKEPLIGLHALPGPENGWHNIEELKQVGYDFFTGYNYSNDICAINSNKEQSFNQLRIKGNQIWDIFAQKNVLPYVPAVTAGWDMRPWETSEPGAFYYTPRDPDIIAEFVLDALSWIKRNPSKTFSEPYVIIYAWNENGEGGYLTPTESEGDLVLKKIKEVIDRSEN